MSLAEQIAEKIIQSKELVQKYQAVLHIHPTPTFIADVNGNVVYANPAMLNLTGADSLEEILNSANTWDDYLITNSKSLSEWFECVRDRGEYDAIVIYKNRKTGELVKTKVIAKQIQNNGYAGFCQTICD